MKKQFSYIFLGLTIGTILLFSNCSKTLNQPNLSNYSPEQVWNDSNLANAYLANLYSVFGNYSIGSDQLGDQVSGLVFGPNAITTTVAGPINLWTNNTNNAYIRIRLVNQGIASVKGGQLSQGTKNVILGQLYFLRAYCYFPMVTSYGGVPYLKAAQSLTDSLNVPRNSTKECFEYMTQDLDSAIGLLPDHIVSGDANYGRIDRNFGLAFKAKVLLYKASPQFNPTNPWDNSYWADAYAANVAAYNTLSSQGYQLISDYSQVALSAGNKEVVFCVINQSPAKVAGWENTVRPGSLQRNTAAASPTWEMVKAFPMLDGKQYDDPTGAYHQTEAVFMQNYWKNRDPRFAKSIVWNADIYPVAGTPAGYRQYTTLGIADKLDAYGVNPNAGVPVAANNNSYTGFFILKNSDLSLTQPLSGNYAKNYNVMRFAEVMLNYAEAANETGHSQDALNILYQIRQRAGIQAGANSHYGITATSRTDIRKAIMNERNVELCFEGFRFNDLRRWRMFSALNGVYKHGLEAIAVNPDGTEMPMAQARGLAATYQLTEANFKYNMLICPYSGTQVNTVPDSYYFVPIQLSVLAAQSQLQQNKDWGGTFDPTIH